MLSPTRGILIMAHMTLSVVAAAAQTTVPSSGQDSVAVRTARRPEAVPIAAWRPELQGDFRSGMLSHDALTANFTAIGAAELLAGHPIRHYWRYAMKDNVYIPESAMAIVAHPDDIEFSCAGTLARWAKAGARVSYVLLHKW